MNRWAFIVEIEDYDKIKEAVKNKAKDIVKSIPPPIENTAVYKVNIIFYQKKERWKKLQEGKFPPIIDIGIDLDNFLQQVLDGLGPIIGYKTKWKDGKPVGEDKVKDSLIIELTAKKLDSGEDKEYLGIEVEAIEILSKITSPRNKKKPKLDWIGSLKEYKDKYTAIELQKKALEWRD